MSLTRLPKQFVKQGCCVTKKEVDGWCGYVERATAQGVYVWWDLEQKSSLVPLEELVVAEPPPHWKTPERVEKMLAERRAKRKTAAKVSEQVEQLF